MFTDNRKFTYIAGGGFVVFILILILIFVFASSKKKTNQTDQSTLTIWGIDDDKSAYDSLISNFQGSNTTAKVQYVKKDSATYLTDSLAEIAAGRGPDIWIIPNNYLPKYHDQLNAMPDNTIADKKNKKSDIEVYQDAFPKVVATDNIIAGKIYGMPLATDTLRLFYNSDMFSTVYSAKTKSGDISDSDRKILTRGPQNWDEFTRAGELLTQKSGQTITQSAVSLGTANIVNGVDVLTLIMMQNGAVMASDDLTSAQFHTSQNKFGGASFPGTKALDFYTSFTNPANANYTWSDSLGDSVRAFAEGKTAMMIGYNFQESDIKRISPKLSYQVINIPQVKETQNPVNFASYSTLTVTKAAKDATLAWKFINFAGLANNGANSREYLSTTKKESALLQNAESSIAPIITAEGWYVPDPVKTPAIFKEMIATVNAGGAAQTAIESAASQVTSLLGQLKK